MRRGSRERVRARIRGGYVDSNLITEAAVRASEKEKERKRVCVYVWKRRPRVQAKQRDRWTSEAQRMRNPGT